MALRDLMNNYFYGKQGKGDYTVADMPQNRFALFGEVLKVRWSGLFGVNLHVSICTPPIGRSIESIYALLPVTILISPCPPSARFSTETTQVMAPMLSTIF